MTSRGFAFGGAGAYGLSYIGVVKYCQEKMIIPDEIVGTSMGSIIGAMWSNGFGWEHMRDVFRSIGWWTWAVDMLDIVDALNDGGVVSSDTIINNVLKPLKWEQCEIPLKIVATDLTAKKMVVFDNDLTLPQAVYASMAAPLAFRGLRIDGHFYVDGGVTSNAPVEILSTDEKLLITPAQSMTSYYEPRGLLEIGMALIETMLSDATLSDLTVEHQTLYSGIKGIKHFLDFENVDENIELGYENAKKFFEGQT